VNNGIYEYEPCENAYDIGTLVVEVKETEKALQLKVIEKDMRYSTYVDVLFGDKDKATINKERSPHCVVYGNSYFIVYPNRAGQPLLFAKKGGGR
jgi:hypothetical protein